MIRALFLCLALVLAQAAWAANTSKWTTERGAKQTAQSAAQEGGCSLAKDRCCFFEMGSSTTADSQLLYVGGFTVSIQFDPDNTGGNETATALVYACQTGDGDGDGTADTFSCKEFFWDSDADGLVDTNQLTFATDQQQALQDIAVAGYLYIDPETAPGSGDEAVVTVCASPQDRG